MKNKFAHVLPFLCFLCIAGTVGVARAQTYSVLYNLGSSPGDPVQLQLPITQGRDGLLYSDSPFGGAYDSGTVFRISSNASPKVLHSFHSSDGFEPWGGLTLGLDGLFYGATSAGGANWYGTIFRITPSGALVTLHDFTASEGYPPMSPVQGLDGNFYGATASGGSGFGVFYKISPSGQFTVLYNFDGTLGSWGVSGLVLGTDGAFYGTSRGNPNYGTIFKITMFGQLTVLHIFDGTHGAYPYAPPYQGTDGNFYGTAYGGPSNAGIVYRMDTSGNFTVLHEMNGGSDGTEPQAGLIQGSDGNFYGANVDGGNGACPDFGSGCGTLFSITPQGVFMVLHAFDEVSGARPVATMVQHTNGLLYGATGDGGSVTQANCTSNAYSNFYCGVIYALDARLPPFVTLSPFFGKPGSQVVILGQGFNAAMRVTFNNAAASFTLLSSTCLVATVPAQASTGRVRVWTTKTNALLSNRNFIVN